MKTRTNLYIFTISHNEISKDVRKLKLTPEQDKMAESRNDSDNLAVIQISSSQKNDEPRNVEENSLDQVNPLSDGTSSNTCCGDKSRREKIISTIAILWTLTVFVSHLLFFPKKRPYQASASRRLYFVNTVYFEN